MHHDLEPHRTFSRPVRRWLPALYLLLVVIIGSFLYVLIAGQAGKYDRIMEQVFSSDYASIQFEGLEWNMTEQQVKKQLHLSETDYVYLKDNVGEITDFKRVDPITFTSPKLEFEALYRFYQGKFWKGEFWISVSTIEEMIDLGRVLQQQIDDLKLAGSIRQNSGFGMLDESSIRSIYEQGMGETMAWKDEAGNICRISIMSGDSPAGMYTLVIESRSSAESMDPEKIVKIAAGFEHVAGLTAGGKVLFYGTSRYGSDQVQGWTDIQDIAAGGYMTVGIKRDGTVQLAGTLEGMGIDGLTQEQSEIKKSFNVSSWERIKVSGAAKLMVFGLHENGSVLADGVGFYKRVVDGTLAWSDITDISVSTMSILGLKEDGTVVVSGMNWGTGALDWTDIRAVYAGDDDLYGLKKDGTVVAQGFKPNASRDEATKWVDIEEIIFDQSSVVGLKKDGTIITAGNPVNNGEVLSTWTDIIDIEYCYQNRHVIGLTSDGTIVSTWRDYPIVN